MDNTIAVESLVVDLPAVPTAPAPAAAPGVIEQDLLVEDVSIDGMCGVY